MSGSLIRLLVYSQLVLLMPKHLGVPWLLITVLKHLLKSHFSDDKSKARLTASVYSTKSKTPDTGKETKYFE